MADAERVDPILTAVDLLAPSFSASALDELEVESEDLRVRLVRSSSPAAVESPAPGAGGASRATPPTAGPAPFGEPTPGMRFVTAPLTGIWYTAPAPGARPYLQVGGEVSAGQVIGLIEAMKLFNEIKADVTGKVARILAESGTLVKRQQPLIEVEPG
ncbi:MAG: acetyl-CoA carboxylase biotin carboxyl carrier protein [Chloroflexi bacterium]|nr:MAG: acetyl-CoA carboxylase biotin carboxyl carrier protein [Chloroflexota bacterium]